MLRLRVETDGDKLDLGVSVHNNAFVAGRKIGSSLAGAAAAYTPPWLPCSSLHHLPSTYAMASPSIVADTCVGACEFSSPEDS